jgi:hypothetical protein
MCGWPTTVAKSGQPVPRLVWFYFDAEGAHPLADERYVAKYAEHAAGLGFGREFLASYDTG